MYALSILPVLPGGRHPRASLETAVARVSTAWLIPPQDGELFNRLDEAFARLQGYALGAGFAVVKGSTTPTVNE